jgi:hypothetical protein
MGGYGQSAVVSEAPISALLLAAPGHKQPLNNQMHPARLADVLWHFTTNPIDSILWNRTKPLIHCT